MKTSLGTKGLLIGMLVVLAIPTALAREGRWKVRAFGARLTSGADQARPPSQGTLYTASQEILLELPDGTQFPVVVVQDALDFQVDPGSGPAFGISAEFRVIDLVGVEAGWLTGQISNEFSVLLDASEPIPIPGLDDPVVIPSQFASSRYDADIDQFHLAANIHLIDPDKNPDVYFGPVFAQVDVSDSSTNVPGGQLRVQGDDASAVGLQVGLDARIGRSAWFVTAGVRYLDFDVTLKFDGDDPVAFPDIDVGIDPYTFFVGAGYQF